jgi:CDP-glucose 4,6-dehydratase
LATVRAGNIIGGGDWSVDRLIPDAVRAFSNNEPVVIRNPLSVRPWQHVCEPVRGYLGLAQMMVSQQRKAPETLNFGPPDEDVRTVGDLVNTFSALWGDGVQWMHDDSVQAYEARTLTIDSQIARRRLGWRPRWTFEQTLAHTVDWYKAYYSKASLEELTMSQLEQALFA